MRLGFELALACNRRKSIPVEKALKFAHRGYDFFDGLRAKGF